MSVPKDHHYVPQMYTRQFCRDGKFWVFDTLNEQYHQNSPKEFGKESHFYSFPDNQGSLITEIEHPFLSTIEGECAPVLRKIESKESLSERERLVLSHFISLLQTRVPAFRKSLEDLSQRFAKDHMKRTLPDVGTVQSMLDRYNREMGTDHQIDPEEFLKMIHEEDYEVTFGKEHALGTMLDLSPALAGQYTNMGWDFLVAQRDTSFITTDNPMTLLPFRQLLGISRSGNLDIADNMMVKLVPLTQSVCLAMYGDRNKDVWRDLSKADVRTINHVSALHAHRYILGRDKAMLQRVLKIIMQRPNWKDKYTAAVAVRHE